jgi:hypothetical protein
VSVDDPPPPLRCRRHLVLRRRVAAGTAAMSDLTEALEDWVNFWRLDSESPAPDLGVIFDAARRWAALDSAREVLWCETHNAEGQTAEKAGSGYVPGLCFGAIGGPNSDQACLIVPALLVCRADGGWA